MIIVHLYTFSSLLFKRLIFLYNLYDFPRHDYAPLCKFARAERPSFFAGVPIEKIGFEKQSRHESGVSVGRRGASSSP